MPPSKWRQYVPILQWGRDYSAGQFASDSIAALIVAVIMLPQAFAFALVAGVPVEMGLYACILPLIAYAIFGTSKTLSVGPVALVSLMTATAIGQIAVAGSADYITAAILLAFISGLLLILMGILKLGFLANFLSHPVIAGFITASSLLIAVSQLKHIIGVQAQGDTVLSLVGSLYQHLHQINVQSCAVGIGSLVSLLFCRRYLKTIFLALGLANYSAGLLAKTGPVIIVIAATSVTYQFDLQQQGVAVVGLIPQGLPALQWPAWSAGLWSTLMWSALFIAIIGYVESVSMGKTLAAKRRQRIDTNQELIGLGAANVASALSSGFPVTGGFSRSVVNFDAGAKTPAASIITAVIIALAAIYLTPLLFYLPIATLAAAIIVAVLSLADFSIVAHAWRCSRSDFYGVLITILITLFFGVERGLLSGVLVSLAMHLYKTSRPHIAIVGEMPGTEHFRNVQRHRVITYPSIISLRVDESLYFANAAFLEDAVYGVLADNNEVEHFVLMCTAVNEIDISALEILDAVNERLKELKLTFNLSEVKGPVMDFLTKARFVDRLNGEIYLTQHQAIEELKNKNNPLDIYPAV
jgi:SulP family sulfate permease